MADQKRVATTYDSGDNNTARQASVGLKTDNTAQSDTSNGDSMLKVVMDDFKRARDYVKDNYQDDWNDYWKAYNGIRTRRGYEGISDDFVPETFTIIESVKANIAGGKPKFTFVPTNDSQRQDTAILDNLLDYYWEQNRMTQKVQNWVQDMLVYGTGVLMVAWENDMPCVYNIPLQDFFVDPTATQLNHPDEPGYPRYAGYRYLTDRDTLKKKTTVDDNGDVVPYYSNLSDIQDYDTEWDKLDKDSKESFLGSTLGKDAVKRQVECIVYFTKKRKIVVANRKTIIYNEETPFKREATTRNVMQFDPNTNSGKTVKVDVPEIKPFLPFAVLRNYVDTSLFYAKGDVAVIIDRQETLNDVSNQKQDNITYVLNNMWQIDPQFKHLAEQIESVPGAVYPIPKGALAPIEKQVVTAEADLEMTRIKDEMRRATAADEVIQGVSQDKGRITATEVNATLNQASQRFTTKMNTLENEGYAQLGRVMFKMIQIFIDQKAAVRIMGQDGIYWEDFDPNEFHGEYEPRVSLESTQKAHRAEEGQKYLQVHELYANSPFINQKEMARVYLEKVLDLPDEKIKVLMDVPPPVPQPPEPNISYSFKADLMPDQTAQILAKEGVQSTPHDLALAAGAIPPDVASMHPDIPGGLVDKTPPQPPIPTNLPNGGQPGGQ